MSTPLTRLLDTLRQHAKIEREKGTYFENLILTWLRQEPFYRDCYKHVWTWAEWVKSGDTRATSFDAQDDGIDLVAETQQNEMHAIQCKFYDADYRLQKKEGLRGSVWVQSGVFG